MSKRFELFASKEMEAGWPDIEKIIAKKVKDALSTKILLLLFLLTMLLLPQGAEAQQVKTVSYMLDQYLDADTTQTDITSGTAWNTKTINIPFPESGVVVRNAWIEFHAVSTTTSATVTQNVSIKFRTNTAGGTNGEYSVIASDPLKKYLSGTTEEFNFWAFADVTPAFATITNLMVVNASIIIIGPPTNQHAATLHITYEYDETSTTQVNTVAFPIATVAPQVGAGVTVAIPYNVTIPEMDSIINAWAEIHAVEVSGGTTDGKLQAAVGSDTISPYYYVEVGSRASYDAVFLFNLTGTSFRANASVLKITATSIPFVTLGGTIYVTYNYTNTHPMRTKTVSYFAGQNTTKGVTTKSQFTAATAFMPEPNATAVAAWAHVLAGWTSATAGTTTISGMIGSTEVGTVAYALDIDTLNMNEHHIFHNMSVANLGTTLINNTAINVTTVYSATTSNGFGAEFLMTYTHNANSSATQQIKTVKYFATQTTREVGANNQNPNITKVQTFIPEAGTLRRSVNLYAIFMSNISTGITAYEILTNISDNGNSANRSVTKSATAVRNTASIFNGDEGDFAGVGPIINATQYVWWFWFAQQSPQPGTARTGAAFSSRFALTYEYNSSTFPPRWSSPAINESAVLMNYNVNFSTAWRDDYGLSSYIFSINQTGGWLNSTPILFSNGGLASNVTSITAAPGAVVEWRFYANDSDNLWNVTAIQTFTMFNNSLDIIRETPNIVGRSKTFGQRLIARNAAGQALSGVSFNDTIPNSWTYVGCSPSADCTYDSTNKRVNWVVGSLATGAIYAAANYTVTATDDGWGDVFSAIGTCSICTNATNNFNITIDKDQYAAAHFAVDLNDSVRANAASTSKVFTFLVTNVGRADIAAANAANVTINVSKSYTSLTSGCTASGGGAIDWMVVCPIASLAVGASTTVSFTATTPSAAGYFEGAINSTGNATFTFAHVAKTLVTNGNFTAGATTNWTYAETDPSNIATSNFAATGGNMDAGSWSFKVVDASTSLSYNPIGNLTNGAINWSGGLPDSANLVYSYKLTWLTSAPINNEINVILVKPDGSETFLDEVASTANQAGYTNKTLSIETANFTQEGNYQIKLVNNVTTPAATKSTVQNYWDDIQLTLEKDPIVYIKNNQTFFTQATGAGADTTPPTWDTQGQSANSVSQFGELYLSVQAQDETNLTWAYLVTNETGAWTNWTGKYGSPQKLGGNTTKQVVNFTWTNFSLEGGQNIGWYIMLNDSTNNTNVTFIQNFSLLKTVSISIANTPAQFSILQPGGSNSTGASAGYNPLPFVINNTGNFAVNITIEADNLFTSFLNPSRFFQFKSEANETNSVRSAAIELIASFLDIPLAGSPTMVANMTNFTDANDEVRVHINVIIPAQEPPSNLTSAVTFTASAAY